LNHGLGLSNSSLEWIQNNLGEELTPEVSNVILQLTSGDLSLNSSIFASQGKGLVKFDEKTTADLEEMLRMAGEMGKSTKGIKKALLINHCRERNLEKAEAVYHVSSLTLVPSCIFQNSREFPYSYQTRLFDFVGTPE